MMIVTKNQLALLNEMYTNLLKNPAFVGATKNLFNNTLSILGLEVSCVDAKRTIIPEPKNEMYWRHARSIVCDLITETKYRIAINKKKISDIDKGIIANDNNRRRHLLNENEYCRRTVTLELAYLEEIEKEG